MSDIIIGIDPGITGAVAVGFLGDDVPAIFDLIAEPASARGEAPGTGKTSYNLVGSVALDRSLRDWLVPHSLRRVCRILALVEASVTTSHNGIRNAVQTARNMERCSTVCQILGAEVTLVAPLIWRSHHGIKQGGGDLLRGDGGEHASNKALSVDKACELWPSLVDTFRPPPPLRKDGTPSKTTPAAKDGRAEAALIWSYGCAVARSR